jgi:hypothetical protein
VVAERYCLGEALTAIFVAVTDRADSASEWVVKVTSDKTWVRIDLNYSGGPLDGLEPVMATRLVQAQRGEVEAAAGRVTIALTASALARRS